jgi:phosphatidate cytidylyltransferase
MKWNNLYNRLVTALIFAALTLFLVLYNELTAHVFLFLVSFLCSLEYLRIRNTGHLKQLKLWALAFIAGPALAIVNYLGWVSFTPLIPLLVLSVVYMIYLAGRLFFDYGYGGNSVSIVFTNFLYLGLPVLLLNQFLLEQEMDYLLINILLIIWASDTFAYLIGSWLGRTKLLPRISPKKSVEGALGGLVFAIIVGVLLNQWLALGSLTKQIFLAVFVWFFGMIGDLVESHLKRTHGLKDSGKLLPGHGGFLDRFDAFVYLLPFVLLYLTLYG